MVAHHAAHGYNAGIPAKSRESDGRMGESAIVLESFVNLRRKRTIPKIVAIRSGTSKAEGRISTSARYTVYRRLVNGAAPRDHWREPTATELKTFQCLET